jgi:hypothetical protein
VTGVRPGRSWPGLGLALVLSCSARLAAGDEGPLSNQAFVPLDTEAAEALARGDAAWGSDPERAVDAWFEALASSRSGAAVPLRASESEVEPRAFEGVEEAVLRRLGQASAADAFERRYSTAAEERLGDGRGSDSILASVEREFPATRAALRAAVVLGDRALARGALDTASTWYERARRHARLGSHEVAPLEPRAALLARLGAENAAPTPIDGAARPVAAVQLEDPDGPPAQPPNAPRAAGLRAGVAVTADGELLVQTASRAHLVDLERGRVRALFEPGALLPPDLDRGVDPYPSRSAPPWVLRPATEGDRALFVVGRASPTGNQGNAMVCVELPARPDADSPRGPSPGGGDAPGGALERWSPSATPRFLWAIDARRRSSAGESGVAELQPGPLLTADRAAVALRSGDAELATELLGIDAADGELLWRLTLVVGRELVDDGRRLQVRYGDEGAATPLLELGGAVVVGTQVGAASMVDLVDGRLRWTVKNRRRRAEERGPSASLLAAVPGAGGVLWAPADGDHLYWLPAGPLADPADAPHAPFLAPPRPIDSVFALVGALASTGNTVDTGNTGRPGGPWAVLLADVGPRQALTARDLTSGARIESLHLFPGEPLREGPWVAPDELWASSDRALYRFDPERELFLDRRVDLPARPGSETARWTRGGSILRVGARLVLLEHDRLSIFEAR